MIQANRRRFLMGSALVAASCVAFPTLAQTQITGRSLSGTGFSPQVDDAKQGMHSGFEGPGGPGRVQEEGTSSVGATAAQSDWRQRLLSGQRSVVVRRGGLTPETIVYLNSDGSLNYPGYVRLCWLMRDVRADQTVSMDLELMNIICGLQRWARYNGVESVINITSGFRTTNTNATTEGASKNSMHIQGRALDFVMQGIRSAMQGPMVQTFNDRGGTGIYIAKNFVHADTGRARVWRG